MKTLIVTGGCGFIGSHFVHMLMGHPGYRVVNLDKLTYAGNLANLTGIPEGPRYRFIRGDIADRSLVGETFAEESPWAVVNFAAESHVDRSILDASPFLQTNVIGVQVLLEATRRHGVERFVQVSTDEVYGDVEGEEPSDEESPLAPSSPYSASKAAADLLCAAYHHTYGVPTLTIRSSNNYGPRQFPEKLIPLVIRNALKGDTIPVYGDGQQRRDWLYVEDNCRAILAVLKDGKPGAVYNVGAGEEHTNIDVIGTVCRLLSEEAGLDGEALLERVRLGPDRPGHDRRYALNVRKIRQELGWSLQTEFQDGLRHTIRWYLEHQEWVAQVTSGEYQGYYEAVYSRNWERLPS